MKTEKSRLLKLRLLTSVVSVVLFWAGLEFILALCEIHFKKPASLFFYGFSVVTGFENGTYLRDPDLLWKYRPNQIISNVAQGETFAREYRINSRGLRDNDHVYEKKPDRLRVVCLGDSWTWGSGADQDKVYPKALEKIINERSGTKIEVINAGIAGYSSLQGLRFFRNELIKYRPDIITLFFGMDDSAPAYFYTDREQRSYPDKVEAVRNILQKSRVYQLMDKSILFVRMKNRKMEFDKNLERVSPEEFQENLSSIMEIAGKNGIKVVVLNYPLPPQSEKGKHAPLDGTFRYNDVVRQWADVHHVPVVDNYSAFKRYDPDRVFHPMFDAHPSNEGHRVIAEELFKVLSNKGWI